MKWRVTKDRANWKGKTPKRIMMLGEPLPYDWEGEIAKLSSAKPAKKVFVSAKLLKDAVNLLKEKSPASQSAAITPQKPTPPSHTAIPRAPPTPPSLKQNKTPDKRETIDVDSCRQCFGCHVGLWIGEESQLPAGLELAFPADADWCNPNVQPYCEVCWDKETQMLAGMGGLHKAIGGKNKTIKSQEQSKPKKTGKTKPKRKRTRKKTSTKKKEKTQKKKPRNMDHISE